VGFGDSGGLDSADLRGKSGIGQQEKFGASSLEPLVASLFEGESLSVSHVFPKCVGTYEALCPGNPAFGVAAIVYENLSVIRALRNS